MLDLRLFRRPAFVGAQVAAFTLSASAFSMFLYFTLYLQNVLGYSPLQAGLRFLPITLLSFIVAPISGKLSAHTPVRLLMGAGLAVITVAMLVMHGLTASSGWTALLPGFILLGAGIGLVNPPLASTAVGVVPPQSTGMGSGANSTFRQVGIATGIAALGAAFEHHLVSTLGSPGHGVASGIVPPALREQATAAFVERDERALPDLGGNRRRRGRCELRPDPAARPATFAAAATEPSDTLRAWPSRARSR